MSSNKNIIKISFVGDIMCEYPYLKASKKKGKYNFDKTFEFLKKYLKNSDYVIGNLETPISNILGYTYDYYQFNTPESLLKSLKDAGFDLLTTANNHCLDRRIEGLKQTMLNIEKYEMQYAGTSLTNEEKKYKIIQIGDIKIAIVAYTYGTNYSYNHYKLSQNDLGKVNLIKQQASDNNWPIYSKKDYYLSFFKRLIFHFFIFNIKPFINKIIDYKSDFTEYIRVDEVNSGEWILDEQLMKECVDVINEAASNSDITIFMLHSGGQFNKEPGSFTTKVIENINKAKIDMLVGTHPHVVQKSIKNGNKLIAYSLGNLNTSSRVYYFNEKSLSDYSILLNAYIDKNSKKIIKYTFCILKSVDVNGYLIVYPLYDLITKENNKENKEKLQQNNLKIFNIFTGKNLNNIELKLEYDI